MSLTFQKRILITGGSGFIGSHLVKKLVSLGHKVTVLDLKDPSEKIPSVIDVRGDVRKMADLKRLVPLQDVVVHLAAQVSVPECEQDPVGSEETNVASTVFLLDLIRNENEKRDPNQKIRIVFSSSSAVYGDLGNSGHPISEIQPNLKPLSVYGGQKLASEERIRYYAENCGVPGVIFRFFNVYGPGQKADSPYSGVISLFVKASKAGTTLRLNGGGTQTRDFISVHDIVKALVLAIETQNPELLKGAPLNLGTGQVVTIRELAETLIGLGGKGNRLEDAPSRAGDILHSRANVERAQALLTWKPDVELKVGLRELCSN